MTSFLERERERERERETCHIILVVSVLSTALTRIAPTALYQLSMPEHLKYIVL